MLKAVILIVSVLCFGILAVWALCPAWRPTIESLSSVFSLVASIAALTVFLQFYITFSQANEAVVERERVARALLVSRITALSAEIIANIQLCNLIESEKGEYLSGHVVPTFKFRFKVASDLVRSGEVTHHKLRAELTSLIIQMESLNGVIDRGTYQVSFQAAFVPERLEGLHHSIAAAMKLLVTKAQAVRAQLAATQPLIEEFVEDPRKYADEKYLLEKLISDGKIR